MMLLSQRLLYTGMMGTSKPIEDAAHAFSVKGVKLPGQVALRSIDKTGKSEK